MEGYSEYVEQVACHIRRSPFEVTTVTFQSWKQGRSISTSIIALDAMILLRIFVVKPFPSETTPIIVTQSNSLVSLCICSQSKLRTQVACRQTRGRFRLNADSRCLAIPLMSGNEEGEVSLNHLLTCTVHV